MEKENVLSSVSFLLPTLGHRPEGVQRCFASIANLDRPHGEYDMILLDGPGTLPPKMKKGVAETKGEWIAFCADDMEFEPDCIDNAIRAAGSKFALVALHEGPVSPDEGNICTHFIIRRDFLPKLERGEIFSTDFHHVGIDNFLWLQAKLLGKALHCDTAQIVHRHWSTGASPWDSTYEEAWKETEKDRAILKEKLAKL